MPERARSVAGVQTPAFVERSTRQNPRGIACRRSSEAFVERSGRCSAVAADCVAGVQTPAFVERSRSACSLRSRPRWAFRVSPEFRLRPSLSEAEGAEGDARLVGVAGVQTPAFVERSSRCPGTTPAFRVPARPAFTSIGTMQPPNSATYEERVALSGNKTQSKALFYGCISIMWIISHDFLPD